MDIKVQETFLKLRWRRLIATLVNTRTSPAMKEHPFSIIQAIIKGVTFKVDGAYDSDNPHVLFHIKNRNHRQAMRRLDRLVVEVFFLRKGMEYAERWAVVLKDYISDPVTGKNFTIEAIGDIEERCIDKLSEELGEMKTEGELCLEFLTPLPFRVSKKSRRTALTKDAFIKSFEDGFSRLFGGRFVYNGDDDDFSVIPYYWNYTEIAHSSKSQPGHKQLVNGCAGRLYLKGNFKGFLPFLVLGSELHAGRKAQYSQGYYILHNDPPGYFKRFFPDKKAILQAIRDVTERYDTALQALSEKEGFPFNETAFAEDLCREISVGSYAPAPNRAFAIKKKDGSERLVEQPGFKDLIVQQYLLKTISEPFDRMFEETSIGFRKGVSRDSAIETVRAAVAEGYHYVIESDIEDFFPSVEHGRLASLLGACMPEKDSSVTELILKSIGNGYVLDGVCHKRDKGLPQGSPLSPILSNLYLDSFDEDVKKLDVRMVRYADDFVILVRSKEAAGDILSKTETMLSGLGLRIKKEKTSIRAVAEGFQFLGMRFDGGEVKIDPEEEIRRFKKPLYVTEPDTFLSLNGDAVDLRRGGALIETLPLRRLSGIMAMERAVFSTALLTKCVENNVPVSITLNTGYYITTIKPDSKKYYDISFEHGRKYRSLSDTECLCIGKEFAAMKIRNYISLFKQRRADGIAILIKELDAVVNRVYASGDIDSVRGFEGAVAKKVYAKLSSLIDNPVFHIKKRERSKPDRINLLLNFGYYLLFSRINAAIRAVGLNPYLGFLHSPQDNYESFVCDVEELFRARIDRFIIRLLNLKVITEGDFVDTERGLYLQKDGRGKFLNQFEAEMERKSAGELSLTDNIHVQANIIKNWAIEDGPLWFYKWEI